MVAWLSDGQRQEKTKQNKKMCMLRNNRNYPYHSYWCYGGTHWPPSTGSIDTVLGEISGATPLGSGFWGVGLTFNPIEDAASEV
jgi:hypothetical protein